MLRAAITLAYALLIGLFIGIALAAVSRPAKATVFNYGLGSCSNAEHGDTFCYANLTAGAGGPLGAQNCSDSTPYCDDETDCSDSDYAFCAGTDTDYYSEGNTTVNYATIGFLACHTTETALLTRKGSGAFQTATPTVICWNTSNLPDLSETVTASFGFFINDIQNGNSRNLVGEWYTDAGTCDAGGADWTKTVGSTAFIIPLSSLVDDEVNVTPLSAPDTVSKTGLTCLRLGIDGVATTASNVVSIRSFNSLTARGPELYLDNEAATPTPVHTATSVFTPTLTSTPTRTPTITPSPTPTSTPTTANTGTPTRTPTNTPTPTLTPTITPSATPSKTFTPQGTQTPTQTRTVGGATATPTATFSDGCANHTINEIPLRQTNFLTTTQHFLCEEDVERYSLQFWPFVVMGGAGSASGGTLELTPLTAFVDGGYVTEQSDIDLSAQGTTTCWVVASKYDFGNNSPFTRVSGTNYLTKCGGSKPLPLALDLMWIAEVALTGGNITSITDLRGWSPGVRYVASSTELAGMFNVRKGQFGYALDSGTLYMFVENGAGSIAEWRVLATSSEAVLVTGNQNITSGVKTFTEFPRMDPGTGNSDDLLPTAGAQFATKFYVDQALGVRLRTTFDIGTLQPGESESVGLNMSGVENDFVCSTSHTTATVGFSWFTTPVGSSTVVATVKNEQSASANPASGTLNIVCVDSDF